MEDLLGYLSLLDASQSQLYQTVEKGKSCFGRPLSRKRSDCDAFRFLTEASKG